jgi:hypothetical protein
VENGDLIYIQMLYTSNRDKYHAINVIIIDKYLAYQNGVAWLTFDMQEEVLSIWSLALIIG